MERRENEDGNFMNFFIEKFCFLVKKTDEQGSYRAVWRGRLCCRLHLPKHNIHPQKLLQGPSMRIFAFGAKGRVGQEFSSGHQESFVRLCHLVRSRYLIIFQ